MTSIPLRLVCALFHHRLLLRTDRALAFDQALLSECAYGVCLLGSEGGNFECQGEAFLEEGCWGCGPGWEKPGKAVRRDTGPPSSV